MSNWMEEHITTIETEKFNCYLDLFEFNGFNLPKFWFGDKVRCGDRTGLVFGLQWRDGEKALPPGSSWNTGWWYQVCLEGRQSLMGFHESSLEEVQGVNHHDS